VTAVVVVLIVAALALAALRNQLFLARARDVRAVIFSGPAVGSGYPDPAVPSDPVAGSVRVAVEVAVTAEERRRGLSGREDLAPSTGMLFVYTDTRPRVFTMEGMLFALDIISLDADGLVTGLVTRRPGEGPFDIAPARYVLEVPAGWAAAHGVSVGSRAVLEGP